MSRVEYEMRGTRGGGVTLPELDTGRPCPGFACEKPANEIRDRGSRQLGLGYGRGRPARLLTAKPDKLRMAKAGLR